MHVSHACNPSAQIETKPAESKPRDEGRNGDTNCSTTEKKMPAEDGSGIGKQPDGHLLAEEPGKKPAKMVVACNVLAFMFAFSVPCWKVYETSHAFREADEPSQYDDVKAFFKASNPPLSDKVGGAKEAMRLYTFILPFWASFFFAFCALLASAWCKPSQAKPKTEGQVAVALNATAVRRSALLKLAQRLSATLSMQVPPITLVPLS